MSLRLYNTLSRKKEIFQPQNAGCVSMYVCGPTVYNYAHIGNARPAVLFDLLYRLLSFLYPQVLYARNITDIDDKIIHKAQEEGLSTNEIAKRYYKVYQQDMQALAVLSPTIEPCATEHLKDIVEMIQKLIKEGCAYEAQKHVLFHVPAFSNYGCLSRRSRKDMIAGARVEVAPYKKDPADFVLWKPSTKEQPGWDSPWGRGRPGWHIECSAMIAAHFGKSIIDIHGGGQDLIFPHHENEIAQSSCAQQGLETCARFWIHNGFVRVNKEKMSKSLDNVFLLHDILKEVPGESVRLALLAIHYRGPLDWNSEILKQANSTLDRFYECLQKFIDPAEIEEFKAKADYKVPVKFMKALEDDLNTSEALAFMHQLASQANSAKIKSAQKKYSRELLACGRLLGILQQKPENWFQKELAPSLSPSLSITEIEALLAQREQARAQGDYEEADAIRDTLAKGGIILKDSSQGTKWQREHSF